MKITMRVKKTYNWFKGNLNGGCRKPSGGGAGTCVEDLLRMKSVPEMNAVVRSKEIAERSQAKDMCPIKRIHVFDLTEKRKNELLARYGLDNEAKRMEYQKKATGR